MRTLIIIISLLSYVAHGREIIEKPKWNTLFKKVTGTIIVLDERGGESKLIAYNKKRSTTRLSPASTYKIPHSLFALDSNIIKDENDLIKWDKVKRAHEPWNQNQTLKLAMQNSTVWVFEKFADEIGDERAEEYLAQIKYGNQQLTGNKPYWINGDLKVSALEQIEFLKTLSNRKLPFSEILQEAVIKSILIEESNNYVYRGKTGWNGKIAWSVGWVESKEGNVYFACNYDTKKGKKDLKLRDEITKGVLRKLNVY